MKFCNAVFMYQALSNLRCSKTFKLKVPFNLFRNYIVCFKNIFSLILSFVCLKVGPSFHSMAAVQQEQTNTALSELQREGCEPSSEENKEPFKWSRLPGQVKCFSLNFK